MVAQSRQVLMTSVGHPFYPTISSLKDKCYMQHTSLDVHLHSCPGSFLPKTQNLVLLHHLRKHVNSQRLILTPMGENLSASLPRTVFSFLLFWVTFFHQEASWLSFWFSFLTGNVTTNSLGENSFAKPQLGTPFSDTFSFASWATSLTWGHTLGGRWT